MTTKWLEFAQKITQSARAGVIEERKRLQEILDKRERKEPPPKPLSSPR